MGLARKQCYVEPELNLLPFRAQLDDGLGEPSLRNLRVYKTLKEEPKGDANTIDCEIDGVLRLEGCAVSGRLVEILRHRQGVNMYRFRDLLRRVGESLWPEDKVDVRVDVGIDKRRQVRVIGRIAARKREGGLVSSSAQNVPRRPAAEVKCAFAGHQYGNRRADKRLVI